MSVKVKTPTGTVYYFDATHVEPVTETANPGLVEPDRKPKAAPKKK